MKFGGSQKCVATRPGCVLGGSFLAWYAAAAISAKETDLPVCSSDAECRREA